MPGRPLTSPGRTALFGKLPAHGDFVRRGDPALVQRLDAWLTGEAERLAATLGDAYDARLAALPVWAFALAEGLGGALAASHDRVGRVFPIAALADGGRAGATSVAELLVQAQAGTLDADSLQTALTELPSDPDPGGEPTADARWWRPLDEHPAAFAIAGFAAGRDFDRLLEGED